MKQITQKEDSYNSSMYKNSGTIAISNNITLLQRKLFNFLVGHAYIDLAHKDIYEIPISGLKNRLGFNSSNNKYLQESLKKLITTAVEFNLLCKDKDDWEASALLSSVKFRSGICYYSFSPILREKLHKPNVYSKLNLNLIKLFSSKYSLCLYEISIDYMKINQTPFIPLDIFRQLMGVDKNKYIEFKRLKARVIDPSIKELNTITGFTIGVEYKKEGKKVVAIKFLLHQVRFEPTEELAKNAKQDKLLAKVQDNYLLQQSLINDFGLTLRQANKIIKEYPIPYIKESLEIIKIKRATGVIKNIPAYTLTVLKNDYQTMQKGDTQKQSLSQDITGSKVKKADGENHSISMDDDKAISKNSLLSTSANLKIDEIGNENKSNKYNSQVTTKHSKAVQAYIKNLGTTQRDKLISEFEKEKINGPILKDLYERKGIEDTLFRVMFEGWIGDIL